MGVTKIDDRGRIVIPKEIRKKMKIRPGDEFLITEVDGDTIIIRRFDVRKMLERLIDNARGLKVEKLENEVESEGNRVAKERYGL